MRCLLVPALIVAGLSLGACRNPRGSQVAPPSPGAPLAPAYEAQRRPAAYPAAPRSSSTRTGPTVTAAHPAPARAAGGVFTRDPPLEQVLARARSAGKPAFLYFETTRCGWCDRMNRETFSQTVVQNRLRSGFVAVRYDAGQPMGRSLAQRYGMPGYPVMVVTDASGREIGRIVGYRDANALIGELAGY